MAYTSRNFRSKADIKRALAAGDKLTVYQPNDMGFNNNIPRTGTVYLEGPHYPEPHRWYAQGEMVDGYLVKIK